MPQHLLADLSIPPIQLGPPDGDPVQRPLEAGQAERLQGPALRLLPDPLQEARIAGGERLDPAVDPDLDAIATLAAQHATSAKALAHLLGVLRATPRARMVPRGASRQMAQVARVRPWEAASDG